MLYFARASTLIGLMMVPFSVAATPSPASSVSSNAGLAGPDPSALEAHIHNARASRLLEPSTRPLTVRGRVDKLDVAVVDDVRISVYRIDGDGRLNLVSQRAVRADANGRYEINLPAELRSEPDLVVEAIHPSVKGSGLAIVPTFGSVSNVLIAPAIDLKSALESDIFLEMASGGSQAPVRVNAIRSLITPRLAAGLRASRSYNQEIALVARATIGAARAWQLALLRPELGLSVEQVEIATSTLDWSQVMLDAQLYAEDSAQQRERAETEYQDLVVAAYATAGIGPEHLAAAAQAAADTMRLYAQAMEGRTRAVIVSEAESLRARYVINAIESLFYAVGAPATERQAVRNAGERLEGRIISAAESSEDVDAFLHRAWNEYQKSILNRLKGLVARDQPERTI